AANPHNTQAWLFKVDPSRVILFADTARNTATMDPYLREMYVGLGCALENLLLAAQAKAYSYTVSLFPDPLDSTRVATVELAHAVNHASSFITDLYDAIPLRHTNRGPYNKDRSLSSELL